MNQTLKTGGVQRKNSGEAAARRFSVDTKRVGD